MSNSTPKCQPGIGRPWIELLGSEVSFYDGLNTAPRADRDSQFSLDGCLDPRGQSSKCGLKKTVFVAEIVRKETRRDIGAGRDPSERAAGKP
jgi:hypothetical protein